MKTRKGESERERGRKKKNTKSAPINHGDIRDSPKDTRLYSNAHDVHTHTFLQITPWPCAEIVDKCVCVIGGSGSQLVITHLAFSRLIVGDDHVVLITCSITANVNKGLHWRPVTPAV